MGASDGAVAAAVDAVATDWRQARPERQLRRHLERADLDRLRDAGLLLGPVPEEAGGWWKDLPTSLRPLCELYRALAAADPSVALVSSMHPSVIAFWLSTPGDGDAAWEEQRQAVFSSAAAGEQWGTITSEPGSGGDISRTRSVATPSDAEPFLPGRAYAVTGDKHFGSGSGVTDRMITTAVPEDGEGPMIVRARRPLTAGRLRGRTVTAPPRARGRGARGGGRCARRRTSTGARR